MLYSSTVETRMFVRLASAEFTLIDRTLRLAGFWCYGRISKVYRVEDAAYAQHLLHTIPSVLEDP